jgi:hypothetical protein
MNKPVFVSLNDLENVAFEMNVISEIVAVRRYRGLTTHSEIVLAGGGSIVVTGTVAETKASLGQALLGLVRLYNITPTPAIALAAMGTDAVSVAGTQYYTEMFNPCRRTVTNIGVLNGTTIGTDDVIVFIANSDGEILGESAAALSAVADVYQMQALIEPVELPPGRCYVGFQVEGTTAAHQTQQALYTLSTGSQAGTWGTIADITSPSVVFAAGVGPFVVLT